MVGDKGRRNVILIPALNSHEFLEHLENLKEKLPQISNIDL